MGSSCQKERSWSTLLAQLHDIVPKHRNGLVFQSMWHRHEKNKSVHFFFVFFVNPFFLVAWFLKPSFSFRDLDVEHFPTDVSTTLTIWSHGRQIMTPARAIWRLTKVSREMITAGIDGFRAFILKENLVLPHQKPQPPSGLSNQTFRTKHLCTYWR